MPRFYVPEKLYFFLIPLLVPVVKQHSMKSFLTIQHQSKNIGYSMDMVVSKIWIWSFQK